MDKHPRQILDQITTSYTKENTAVPGGGSAAAVRTAIRNIAKKRHH